MRRLITTVLVGGSGLVFSVYLLTGGTISEQVADAADAGISPPNRDATCPVRLDPDFAADAGLGVYQRVLMPVSLKVLADGGLDRPRGTRSGGPPMKTRALLAALALGAVAGGFALKPREGCGAKCCRRPAGAHP